MEEISAARSVKHFRYAEHAERGFTPLFIVAAISVVALLGVIIYRISTSAPVAPLAASGSTQQPSGPAPVVPNYTASAAASEASAQDPISQIGTKVIDRLSSDYTDLQQLGIYSSSTVQAAANDALTLMQAPISYPTFSAGEIQTTADTSYARMLAYRSDLQTSLAPLLKNSQAEYEIFASYVQTNDPSYLTKLQAAAQNYFAAASSTAQVVVPADAVPYHVAILNAMEEFGSTLDAMAAHANDPFAAAALLRAYNQAESDMLNSFNALATYYKSKQS